MPGILLLFQAHILAAFVAEAVTVLQQHDHLLDIGKLLQRGLNLLKHTTICSLAWAEDRQEKYELAHTARLSL
jgi:hypothetical protein